MQTHLELKKVLNESGFSVRKKDTLVTIERDNITLSIDLGCFSQAFIAYWTGNIKGCFADLDVTVAKEFVSNEILRQTLDVNGLLAIRPYEHLFVLEGLKAIAWKELPSFSEEPFYVVLNMAKVGPMTDWRRIMRHRGYSHYFDSGRELLYVSNTVGASHGLPPTAYHLGLGASLTDFGSNPASKRMWNDIVQRFGCPGQVSRFEREAVWYGSVVDGLPSLTTDIELDMEESPHRWSGASPPQGTIFGVC